MKSFHKGVYNISYRLNILAQTPGHLICFNVIKKILKHIRGRWSYRFSLNKFDLLRLIFDIPIRGLRKPP